MGRMWVHLEIATQGRGYCELRIMLSCMRWHASASPVGVLTAESSLTRRGRPCKFYGLSPGLGAAHKSIATVSRVRVATQDGVRFIHI